MPALFDLPREVRDNILDFVVIIIPVSFPGGLTKLPVYGNPPELSGEQVQYSNFVEVDIIPTLLVNRQLKEETQEAINRIRSRASYTVEVEIFEERDLRVKWISVPALTTKIETLRATIFSEGVYRQGVPLFRTEDWTIHAEEGLKRTWTFCSLLDRFIKLGPVGAGPPDNQKRVKGVSIKNLVLDFRTPNIPENMIQPQFPQVLGYPQLFVRYNKLCDLRSQTGIDYVMRPEYVAEFLHRYIDHRILQEERSYGALLYERIGRIEMLVDGLPYKSIDLVERVASRRYRDKNSHLFKAVAKWKEGLFKKRVEYGLPVWQEEA